MKKGRICKKRTINCICGKELNIISLKKHIKTEHGKINDIEFNSEYYNIMYGKKDIDNIIKDYKDGFGIVDLCEKYELLANDVYFILKFNNIEKRTVTNSI